VIIHIRIGGHVVPLWLVGLILSVALVGAYVTYVTFNVPLTIMEPLEVSDYPSTLSLYPGETIGFNLTVKNHASISYALFLDFDLSNKTYADSYVTTSNETYIIHPGTQSLAVWLSVSSKAPALDTTLSAILRREPVEDFMATEQIKITNLQFPTGFINVTMLNTGTNTVTITEIHVNNGQNLISTANPTWNGVITANGNATEAFTFAWVNGAQYEIELRSSKGNQFTYTGTAPV